jgi:phytoene dehydrogenase-like protein
VFDISLHGFPHGMVKTCRRHWGPAIADSIVRLDGVRFDNPQFSFATEFTRDDFTDKLVSVFGLERATVEAFYDHIRALDYFDDSGDTVADLFERFFPGRNDVHRLLLEPIAYANGSTLEDPAIAYGIVFNNFMSKGVYTFSGGTDVLIREMRAELLRNGVELFNHVQVDRVLVEDGRAVGIEAAGRRVRARTVISNAGFKNTVLDLVGPEHLEPDYVEGVRAVRLNCSSCQVYMGLREGETIPDQGDLLFTSTRPTFDSPALADMHGESRTFSFYYPKTRPPRDPANGEPGRYTVVSSTNARWTDWADLDDAAYEREKRRLIEDTLVCLEGYLPGVRDKLDHVEAATPRTFRFYTQHMAGASFGTKFEGLRYSMELPRQVPGLWHAGSVGIIMSGWLGAANYGVNTASKVDAHLAQLVEATA